ncbi:MAG: hypothetical protein AB1816_15110 [Bacillota bacterium]
MEGLLLAGMVLATVLCVAGAVLAAFAWLVPYAFRLRWRGVCVVASAGLAAFCLSLLKVFAR